MTRRKDENPTGREDTVRIKTLCPLCLNRDGIVATVQNGRITRLEGDREHRISRGCTCIKDRHARETIYHITYMLDDVPFFLAYGTKAYTVERNEKFFDELKGPKDKFVADGADHFDMYYKPEYV